MYIHIDNNVVVVISDNSNNLHLGLINSPPLMFVF